MADVLMVWYIQWFAIIYGSCADGVVYDFTIIYGSCTDGMVYDFTITYDSCTDSVVYEFTLDIAAVLMVSYSQCFTIIYGSVLMVC